MQNAGYSKCKMLVTTDARGWSQQMQEDTIHEHGILNGGPHPVQDPTPNQGSNHGSHDGDPAKGEVYGLPPHPK